MDITVINEYELQYEEKGGCWNKVTCIKDGKIETYSGPGSLLENTDQFVESLSKFIKDFNIKSIIDAPCGDFNFMSKVDLTDINYLGLDISKNAIEKCNKKNNNPNIQFKVADITSEQIPYADLIIIKDLFLHLCFSDITKILNNVKLSGCKYFAVSRYNHGNITNKDQNSGLGCRAIEITNEPFNFNYNIIYKTYYSSKESLKDEMIFFKIN
jgi:hypothetical protein